MIVGQPKGSRRVWATTRRKVLGGIFFRYDAKMSIAA
jgi:hypothetical protein